MKVKQAWCRMYVMAASVPRRHCPFRIILIGDLIMKEDLDAQEIELKALEKEADDIDLLISELGKTENYSQQLIEKSSIDIFGTATRDFSNKLILWCSIGLLISTVGTVNEEINAVGLKIHIDKLYVIPVAVMSVLVFYVSGLLSLSYADYRRWSAVYAQNVRPLTLVANKLQIRNQETLKEASRVADELVKMSESGEDMGPEDNEGIPLAVKNRIFVYKDKIEKSTNMIKALGSVGIGMKRQAMISFTIFIIFPLLYSIAVGALLINSALIQFPH